ncbi:hypothetical protein NDA11_003406 [Ustilago hordei]|uniref:Uncharacterized protein n=1 Tax=Ustilago hordei TaxID=120017 RepID=I2FMV5_USTHO|nr:uncharacterized protein UHO2_04789 [Ustilago hordei]KAJ1041842.1 hypothetical protein NDA10_003368 [Ustilago hordei]KAJ1575370.1 hypothetical protein NDA15_000669 [Ustilago hordei]KAJ1577153.1 hypothetical protein NDA12_000724 [Ustilago hordei]KAJ1595146.1 hypothetical protein NDA11_003406 [Ustilago hordei]CCF48248.1 uncharacterized protein UHOR_05947 [Ustilago hordei]
MASALRWIAENVPKEHEKSEMQRGCVGEVQALEGHGEERRQSMTRGQTATESTQTRRWKKIRRNDRQVKGRGRRTNLGQARGRDARADCNMLRQNEARRRQETMGDGDDSEQGKIRPYATRRAVAWSETWATASQKCGGFVGVSVQMSLSMGNRNEK